MSTNLQITFRGMDPSDAIAERIRVKAACFERFATAISSCHVTVEVPHDLGGGNDAKV